MQSIAEILARELEKPLAHVQNVINLLDEGNTIPFIARYRKELHGSMDDTALRTLEDRLNYLRNLAQRREEVKNAIDGQGKLTQELSAAIDNAATLAEVEDLYRPYKQKRRTRATIAREKGLRLPIVCNTGGYETVESVEAWRGYIDIWLADLKYVSSALSAELSAAPDYFAEAKPAIEAMMAQAGHPVFDADGILQKGVILRHLALPGHVKDSFAVLDQMAAWNDADPGCFLPSVMSQYTPFYKAAEHGIGRRITTYEYRRVVNYAMDKGLVQGYMQQKSSAKEEYTPSFDLTGV